MLELFTYDEYEGSQSKKKAVAVVWTTKIHTTALITNIICIVLLVCGIIAWLVNLIASTAAEEKSGLPFVNMDLGIN